MTTENEVRDESNAIESKTYGFGERFRVSYADLSFWAGAFGGMFLTAAFIGLLGSEPLQFMGFGLLGIVASFAILMRGDG